MNKKSIFIILFFILTISIKTSFSQAKQTFTVPDSLISELKTYYGLNGINLKKNKIAYEKDSIISSLGKLWASNINQSEKKTISNHIKTQVKKRFKKDKAIWNYINTIIYLKNKQKTNFLPWLNMFDYMLNSSKITSGDAGKFINNTYNLLANNYLSKTKTAKWKIKNNTNYKFEFNKIKHRFNIKIPKTKIIAISLDNDTISIFNTSGTYNIRKAIYLGKEGTITWEKFGFAKSEMNASFKDFIINTKKIEFEVKNVTYVNKSLVDKDILGTIIHKASARGKKEGLYPMFRSNNNNFKIKGKQKNVFFMCGVEMRGKTLRLVGTAHELATAKYIKDGKTLIKVKSEDFVSSPTTLRASQADITMYIAENDSITHPNVSITIKEDNFSFTRNPKGTGNRSFYNSFQKANISVDNISWNTKDSLIRFYSRLGNDAHFKSFDYFTKGDFTKYQMYETSNPLFNIRRYTKKIGSRTFFASDYAAFVKHSTTGVVHRLMGIWYDGFIDYNPKTRLVTVRQKLYDYIDYFYEKKDYDVIDISSKGKPRKDDNSSLFPLANASYDIKSNKMALYGVERVILNKRKKIGFVPADERFILGQNRNMFFSGRLRAGLADIYGAGFSFNYDNYDITFPNADSLVYRVWDTVITDKGKSQRAKYLTSTIEKITGKIRIDVKTNKSGAKKIDKFPILTCTDTSYVYYDRRNKQGKTYKRENFHFTNYPFKHDSLLYITKEKLRIKGKMFSGGIFPVFEDTLLVQNDYSLGFLHETPEGGMPLFAGKGTLSSQNNNSKSFIKLSNKGFEANGVARWHNTTIATKEFNLYPDSLTTLADEIEISEFINPENYAEFPVVKGKLISTMWDATKDVVKYKTTKSPAEMYDKKVQFSGEFEFRPKSLTGKGKAIINNSVINAKDFSFSKKTFLSDKANIEIKEENSKKKDVIINNMKSFVDTKANKAVFAKRDDKEDPSYVKFVTDQYLSYPTHLVWNTDEGKISLNKNMSKFTNPTFSKEKVLLDSSHLVNYCGFDKTIFAPQEGSLKFISTHRDQDSLMFFGSSATYSTSTKRIVTSKVNKIIVADIVVTPSSDVTINKNGEMEKLLKTTVKARHIHNIADVDIKINSSKKYVASSGIYQYEDMNKKLQNINFDNITYDVNKGASVAHGFIEQYEKFTLNPWFNYHGDVYFNATKDRLRFEGYAKIIQSCTTPPSWFYFKSEINPDSIYLPLSPDLHSEVDGRVYADIMSSRDSIHAFPVFLAYDEYGTSESIFSLKDSFNYVTYDQKEDKYIITQLEKFKNKSIPGKYLDLDRTNCSIHGEGKISLTKQLKIDDIGAYGEITFDTKEEKITMNTLSYFDFFFSKKALNILSDKIILNTNLDPVDVKSVAYMKQMSEVLGISKTNDLILEMSLNMGKPKKFPEELNKTLVFTNLFFKWDAASKSYKSMGKIGISNIGDKMINKYVNGHIQVVKRKTGDRVYIYLEITEDEWFFFAFSGSILRTFSSVSEYNTTIADLKTRKKKKKTDKGIFNYMLTNLETRNLFIFKFTGIHPAIDDFDDSDKDSENAKAKDDDEFEDTEEDDE